MGVLLVSSICFVNTGYAALPLVNGTPTQYSVTVSQVAFHKVGDPSDTFTSYASGSGQYDIASVVPNANVGVLSATGVLSAGVYDQIRFTISKTMALKGASNGNLSNGLPCRTSSAGTVINDPLGNGSVSAAYLGAADSAAPQLESTAVPSGSGVILPSGVVDMGNGNLQITMPVSVRITNGSPNAKISINVTNAMIFFPLSASTCAVYPGPPTVNVTVS